MDTRLALGPKDAYDRTPSTWERWFHKHNGHFQVHTERAGILVVHFMDGVRYVRNRFRDQFIYPGIGFLESSAKPCFYLGMPTNVAGISTPFLRGVTEHPLPEAPGSFAIDDTVVFFRGTLRDLFVSSGLEEGHHAWFLQQHPEVPPTAITVESPQELLRYKSEPQELAALEFLIESMKDVGLHRDSQEYLRSLFAQVMELRGR